MAIPKESKGAQRRNTGQKQDWMKPSRANSKSMGIAPRLMAKVLMAPPFQFCWLQHICLLGWFHTQYVALPGRLGSLQRSPGFTFIALLNGLSGPPSGTPLPHTWSQQLSLTAQEDPTAPYACIHPDYKARKNHMANATNCCLLGLGPGSLLAILLHKLWL